VILGPIQIFHPKCWCLHHVCATFSLLVCCQHFKWNSRNNKLC